MTYFKETEQLLSEVSFLGYASRAYKDFIDLEAHAVDEAIAHGETFNLNVKRWFLLCKEKEPKRSFGGGVSSFLLYVKLETEALLYKDWKNFKGLLTGKTKDNQAKLAEFVHEATDIRETIKHSDYLEPLMGALNKVLDSIFSEYGEAATKKTLVDGQEVTLEPMQWNDNTNVLITLFYDLSKKMLSNKRVALDATPEQMKAFISLCFVGKDGKRIPEATLNTCFQEDKPDKRATKNKVQTDKYVEHED